MNISNEKIYVTKHGDGAITFQKDNKSCKVFISKDIIILKDIFDYYYNQLDSFKNRHYALAKWLARDIRNAGYIFKAYANNPNNIRPVKKETCSLKPKLVTEQELLRNHYEKELCEMERLLH